MVTPALVVWIKLELVLQHRRQKTNRALAPRAQPSGDGSNGDELRERTRTRVKHASPSLGWCGTTATALIPQPLVGPTKLPARRDEPWPL
ncbi:hypothetical protein GGTG_13127 [Gaeumannomyces tritici R3-111a-1]|uniref:Uncharacterized protein n=1 Tax=Gaeumannomyces tritici (strain R3-111a-1) TaxID=644352 RepID=J3PHZ6_GAET3|nr:hypothetical protein GGTG_13127 [Gaeumannomyces tritici R3-111a-1]EJT69508.1 hypothetical protein GGTG_13127 [Gaeumannomyces tritici R3-111a-1]